MRGMIAVANLIPSILIVIFVTMMARELLKTDSFLLQANDSAKTSIIVIVIALIVVGVELSTGILMSLYALKISTGLFIVSFETFQLAAFAFDIILHVSYFVIFLMSRDYGDGRCNVLALLGKKTASRKRLSCF